MPKIDDTIKGNNSKKFKPKTYRAWSLDDNDQSLEKRSVENQSSAAGQILLINPANIQNWEFHDRPESELGDIQSLANDFIKIGQQQPCIVRPALSNKSSKYELIVGERRWRAAQLAGIDLKVIVNSNMSDIDAALSQAAENDNREDLSNYAKGISFARLINDGVLKQKDLIDKLGKPQQYISRLLSYSKIPKEIIEAVGDWTKVTPGTSETIVRLSKKGDEYIKAMLDLAEKIRSKKVGEKSLESLVSRKIKPSPNTRAVNEKVFTKDGRHVFTWRLDNNGLPSMHFPKHINNLFAGNKIDTGDFTKEITKLFETKFQQL